MPKENKSRFVVLGILSIKPMSGYDIKSWISLSVGLFWKISYNQIYPALDSFVAEGLATYVTDKKSSRPERKVYSITEAGLEALKKWLLEPLDCKSPSGNELLVKLFFSYLLPLEETLRHLNDYRDYLCKRLAELKAIENMMRHENSSDISLPYRRAALDNGIVTFESLMKWCDRTIAFFENQGKSAESM